MSDPIHIVERAYDLTTTSEMQWLKAVAEATTATLSLSDGAIACSYQVRPDGRVDIRAMHDLGTPAGFAAALLRLPAQKTHPLGMLFGASTPLGSALKPLRGALAQQEFDEYFQEAFAAFGFKDFIAFNASDASRGGCIIGYPCRSSEPPRWKRLRWARLAAHIAAGLRLQRKLHGEAPSDGGLDGEAILTPEGRIEDATGEATSRPARERLRAAALANDRARSSLRRRPDEALETWRALVAGRWSLVDRFESDGRRYLVAVKNSPAAPDPRALTEREQQVAAYAALGHSNKLIAYELGLSSSTVGVLLGRARQKLASGTLLPDG